MDPQEVKQIIVDELPGILEHEPRIQELIRQISRGYYADQVATERRFDRLLDELRQDREAENERWAKNQEELKRMREESEQRWAHHLQEWQDSREELKRMREQGQERWEKNQEALQRMREESEQRWTEGREELRRMREESEQRWAQYQQEWQESREELKRMREEGQQRWEKNQEELQRMHEESERRWVEGREESQRMREESQQRWEKSEAEFTRQRQLIEKHGTRLDHSITAIGARWGIYSEQSYRNALKGLLEDSFNVQVINALDFDDEGEVFGRPEQIELGIVIKDSLLIICEIKSSMSKSEMYTFIRKAAFYEKKHERKASRLMVISPMVDDRAKATAKTLGIEVYSHANDIDPEVFSVPASER